jgi:peptidoglycan/LPS O-acetylase OafA/YrhL
MARAFTARQPFRWPAYLTFDKSSDGIAALDGLRAAAILLVLSRHAVMPFRAGDGDGGGMAFEILGWQIATPLVNGWIGVDLFFVLSGFLISHGIIRRQDNFRLGRYVARRALRIVPAYYAMLAVAAAGLIPFYTVTPDVLGIRILYHALFLQDYLPSGIVVAFWSLGVEEKFYIAAPFVLLPLLALRRRGLQYAVLGGLVLTPLAFRLNLIAGGAEIANYETFFRTLRSPFHRGFDGLAAGMLVALLWRDRNRWRWMADPRAGAAIFWAGAAAIGWLWLAAPLLDHIDAFDRTALQLVLAAGFGAILLGTLLIQNQPESGNRGAIRVLAAPMLRPIAILSYSLYLAHMTVIPAAKLASNAIFDNGTTNNGFEFIIFSAFYLIFSLLLAGFLYFAVEKPFLRLRDAKF